jgi:hypothetical protein
MDKYGEVIFGRRIPGGKNPAATCLSNMVAGFIPFI